MEKLWYCWPYDQPIEREPLKSLAKLYPEQTIQVFHQDRHLFTFDTRLSESLAETALAFNLSEVGEGDGVAQHLRPVREVFTDELKMILSFQVILCCRMERQALLNEVCKRHDLELRYDRHRRSIGILKVGQRVILIKPYHIAGGKLLLEQDLHDLDQIGKVRFRYWLYIATKTISQPILPRWSPAKPKRRELT